MHAEWYQIMFIVLISAERTAVVRCRARMTPPTRRSGWQSSERLWKPAVRFPPTQSSGARSGVAVVVPAASGVASPARCSTIDPSSHHWSP